MTAATSLDLAAAVELVKASPRHRVLDLFEPRARYREEPWGLGDGRPLRRGVFVDAETTGLDRELDEITQFGAVPFTYHVETGEIYAVLPGLCQFEEPTRPIPEDVQEMTGITPAMVKGQRINGAAVHALVADAAIVVAHNADYDRMIVERRFAFFAQKHWACSQREVPWARFGVAGQKLEHILAGACGMFASAHRADIDCQVGIHCLATARLDERPAMAYLLESARQPTVRVYAINTPFHELERLKVRRPRYRWSDGSRQPKAWYIDLRPDAIDAEVAWLRESIYKSLGVPRIPYGETPTLRKGEFAIVMREFGSRDRYSGRIA